MPKLSETLGQSRWPGQPLGAHNAAVFGGERGLSEAEVADLQARGVI